MARAESLAPLARGPVSRIEWRFIVVAPSKIARSLSRFGGQSSTARLHAAKIKQRELLMVAPPNGMAGADSVRAQTLLRVGYLLVVLEA